MRRKEREISDIAELEAIISSCSFCRLAMCRNNLPYIVPMSFGYQNQTLFFHSAKEGMKLDMLRENPRVCVQFDADCNLRTGKTPCDWGFQYRSVIGFGTASILEDPEKALSALEIIIHHYHPEPTEVVPGMVKGVVLFQVVLDEITGKKAHW